MTLAERTISDAGVGVAVVDGPERLSDIQRAGCAAAVWRRRLDPRFREWIEELDPSALPRMRQVLRPEAVRDAVAASFGSAPAPDEGERDWFIDDVASLAACFLEMMRAPYLRLRLDVVETNSCRKFHVDAVSCRLICTYRGTGTQYGVSTDGADPKRVFTAPTGAPIVLRGTLLPEDPPSGLLHRSPPIAGTGETRLLLVLDPMNELEE